MKPGKSLQIVLPAVIALLALLAVMRIVDERNTSESDISTDSIRLKVATDCQIEKGCVVSAQNLSAGVLFKSPVRYLKPFPLIVTTSGLGDRHVTSVTMEFFMRGMEMPIRPVTLTNSTAEHVWQAEGVLPVCVSGRRDWIGRLIITTDTASYKTDIVFKVSN